MTVEFKLLATATDYATLDVADDGLLTITTVDADAAEGDICLMPDGNVGIGTTSPSAKLTVGVSTAGTNDMVVGQYLIRESTGTPASNMGIGYNFVMEDAGSNLIQTGGLRSYWVDPSTGVRSANTDIQSTLGNSGVTVATFTSAGNVGIGIEAPLAKLHIDQSVDSAALPVLSLDQADISDGFINFIGAAAASAAGPISSWTNATINGFVRAEVNGAQVWLATYNDPTS